MTVTDPPATPRRARAAWPNRLILGLRRLIRTHEDSSVRLVIATHIIMVALDLLDRATYQTIAQEPTLLHVWAESPIWVALGVATIVWLVVWSRPPRVIWGLWVSTAVLAGWGAVNLTIGLTALNPVSLLGPALILGILAPLAWLTADTFQDRVTQEVNGQIQVDAAIRRQDSGG